MFDQKQNRCFTYVSTLAKTGDRLTRLVQLLDFSKQYKFVCIMENYCAAVLEALRRQNVETDTNVEYLLYYLPREEALEFEPK